MADAYREHIHARCQEADGRVFVAEQDGTVVGFVAILARENFTELGSERFGASTLSDSRISTATGDLRDTLVT